MWKTVTLLGDKHQNTPRVQCNNNNCGATFCGGATRITEHILRKCTCDTTAFCDLKDELLALSEASHEKSSGARSSRNPHLRMRVNWTAR